jgi:hypothetical protein
MYKDRIFVHDEEIRAAISGQPMGMVSQKSKKRIYYRGMPMIRKSVNCFILCGEIAEEGVGNPPTRTSRCQCGLLMLWGFENYAL